MKTIIYLLLILWHIPVPSFLARQQLSKEESTHFWAACQTLDLEWSADRHVVHRDMLGSMLFTAKLELRYCARYKLPGSDILMCLPPRDVAANLGWSYMHAKNRYRKEAELDRVHQDYWTDLAVVASRWEAFWDYVKEAQSASVDMPSRRMAVKRAIDLVGEKEFWEIMTDLRDSRAR